MANVWGRLMSGLKAFREAYMHSDPLDVDNGAEDFGNYDARKARYAVLWAYYQNDAYRKLVNKWAQKYLADYGLYKYTRHIYNPSARLGTFWRTYLMGGALDAQAGPEGAIPIATENEALRPALAQLWQWSNWQINKGVWTLWGATLGDVALQVVDDVARGKVYLKVVHPGTIKHVDLDAFGNVKGYVIEEERPNPLGGNKQSVVYREEATRDSGNVVYLTTLDGVPYAWNGTASTWAEPYGFVPMVLTRHNDVGLTWGWSEIHTELSRVREIDDVASKLSDQIRKTIDAVWLFSGVQGPSSGVTQITHTSADSSGVRPEAGRDEAPALYGPVGATATPLVAPLDITGTLEHIKGILAELERELPELQMDIWAGSGETSGRALRVARQRVESKVQERRAGYDSALVRAHQMAIAIGGERGVFEGFGLDSYANGQLDHSIMSRPVFRPDPLDEIEIEQAFWNAAVQATKAGMPLMAYLRENGWDDARILALQADPEWMARQALTQMGIIGMQAGEA